MPRRLKPAARYQTRSSPLRRCKDGSLPYESQPDPLGCCQRWPCDHRRRRCRRRKPLVGEFHGYEQPAPMPRHAAAGRHAPLRPPTVGVCRHALQRSAAPRRRKEELHQLNPAVPYFHLRPSAATVTERDSVASPAALCGQGRQRSVAWPARGFSNVGNTREHRHREVLPLWHPRAH